LDNTLEEMEIQLKMMQALRPELFVNDVVVVLFYRYVCKGWLALYDNDAQMSSIAVPRLQKDAEITSALLSIRAVGTKPVYANCVD
jgi:hypothetical protein